LAQSPLTFNNQTLRQIVHVSIGGERVRAVFSNTFGTAPLGIGAAHIGLRDKDASIVGQSDRVLTFSGSPKATIPAGAMLVSDPVNLTVPALADLAIDLYLPDDVAATNSPVTMHAAAWQTNYVSPPGNFAGVAVLPVQATTGFLRVGGVPSSTWFFLARVEVMAAEQTGAIVTLGDSITDGTQSGNDTNNRWPDHLARRFAQQNIKMGILNVGIGGNRVLTDGAGLNALARLERDVLAQTGVTHVIVLEGINDIGQARQNPYPSAADIIAGHRQIIERAHARGLKIYGATLTPFEGANYWTPEGEAKRQALNQWIRTSKMYDAVIDFEAAVRDPNQPTKLLPQYDPGDHLHTNAGGYQAMANAIDLALFQPTQPTARTASR
jgi:lysophospholipase L1-like esterase